jgi:hypothetical protein
MVFHVSDPVKEDETDGSRATHGTDEMCIKSLSKNLMGRDYLWRMCIHGKIILERTDWMQLAEDRDKWLGTVTTVMKLRVTGNILTS